MTLPRSPARDSALLRTGTVLEPKLLGMKGRFVTFNKSLLLGSLIMGLACGWLVLGTAGCGPLAGSSIDKRTYLSNKNGQDRSAPGSRPGGQSRPEEGRVEIRYETQLSWRFSELRSRTPRLSWVALTNRQMRALIDDGSLTLATPENTSAEPAAFVLVFDDASGLPSSEARSKHLARGLPNDGLWHLQLTGLNVEAGETSHLAEIHIGVLEN